MVDGVQASERRFRALIEHSADGIALLDHDYAIRYASPATEYILGYSPAEFMKCQLADLVHPADWPDSVRRMVARIPGERETTSPRALRLRHQDGTYRWLEYTGANLLDDPDIQAIVVNYRDITERKHVRGDPVATRTGGRRRHERHHHHRRPRPRSPDHLRQSGI